MILFDIQLYTIIWYTMILFDIQLYTIIIDIQLLLIYNDILKQYIINNWYTIIWYTIIYNNK